MKKRNKLITQRGTVYLLLGAKRIVERLFGKEADPAEITFKVTNENASKKTLTIKLYRGK